MIKKLSEFPLERLYFLESEEFFDLELKYFLKKNRSFKLNSYYLGLSKTRVNNDKLINLFNGLTVHYYLKSQFVKNPDIMEKKPPISNKSYKLIYNQRKYKFQDLIIYSLKIFSRPTVSLYRDVKSLSEIYIFPLILISYLNNNRKTKINNENYKFCKQNYAQNLYYNKFKFSFKNKYKNNLRANFRGIKLKKNRIIGFSDCYILIFHCWMKRRLIEKKKIINKFYIRVKSKRKKKRIDRKKKHIIANRINRFKNNMNKNQFHKIKIKKIKKLKKKLFKFNKSLKFRRKFYKTRKLIQLLVSSKKIKRKSNKKIKLIPLKIFRKLGLKIKNKLKKKKKRVTVITEQKNFILFRLKKKLETIWNWQKNEIR